MKYQHPESTPIYFMCKKREVLKKVFQGYIHIIVKYTNAHEIAMSKELNILVMFKFTIHTRTIVTPFHSKLLLTVR